MNSLPHSWMIVLTLCLGLAGSFPTSLAASQNDSRRSTAQSNQESAKRSGKDRATGEDVKPNLPADLRKAELHLKRGRHEEAIAAFDRLLKPSPVPVATPKPLAGGADGSPVDSANRVRALLGKSHALQALSRIEESTSLLEQGAKSYPRAASLRGRLAELAFRRGRHADAEKQVAEALRLDGQDLRARLVQADLFAATGRLTEALDGYRWFVRYYNRAQPEDAQSLMFVARGSLEYARWARSNQIFDFVINTLCVDALKNDPDHWEADYLSGSLLLEKYNRAQGIPDMQKALAKNPRAAEVLTALADAAYEQLELEESKDFLERALKVAPRYVPALTLRARLLLGSGEFGLAEAAVKLALAENPRDPEALATLGAIYLLVDGPPPADELTKLCDQTSELGTLPAPSSRFGKLAVQVVAFNKKPGRFFNHVAELVESRRNYDLAERFYNVAIRVMPQLAAPRTALGMLYMRTGRTKEAGKIFDEAFRADPYHVRVSNMRKVVKLLEGYETLSTPHFVIRYDNKSDKILARYLAEYLEEAYPEVVRRYGFEPPSRTVFEIYNNAKGLSGHEWFSARMTGLPWIQTVGASTGVMVAFTSPSAAKEPFHWARVARHEFTHVVTLQQTRFQIPHWFTEALAVTEENSPRPAVWNKLLAERVPAGKLHSLDELNQIFIRPKSPADWQFAYCQSRLYAQFILEKHGADKIAKMLDGYRRNLPTPRVIRETFGIDSDQFDREYRDYLKKLVAGLPASSTALRTPLAELAKNAKDRPDDIDVAARYAEGLRAAGQTDEAKDLANKTLKRSPKHLAATLVLAKIEEEEERHAAVVRLLQPLLDRTKPDLSLLRTLAKNQLLQGRNAEAVELFELGLKLLPDDVDLLRGAAAGYLRLGETKLLRKVLTQLARGEGDNFELNKRLAKLALADQDFPAAIQHGREALYMDVLDAENHRTLALAYRGAKQHDRSIREWEVALEIEPKDATTEIELARSLHQAGRKPDARARLEVLLRRDKHDDEEGDVAEHKKTARRLLDEWK